MSKMFLLKVNEHKIPDPAPNDQKQRLYSTWQRNGCVLHLLKMYTEKKRLITARENCKTLIKT